MPLTHWTATGKAINHHIPEWREAARAKSRMSKPELNGYTDYNAFAYFACQLLDLTETIPSSKDEFQTRFQEIKNDAYEANVFIPSTFLGTVVDCQVNNEGESDPEKQTKLWNLYHVECYAFPPDLPYPTDDTTFTLEECETVEVPPSEVGPRIYS